MNAYLKKHTKMLAVHYLPSLVSLVSASWHDVNGGFLFKSLFDPCKLLYAVKSRMDIAQVGQKIDRVRMTGDLLFFLHIELQM